MIKIINTAFQVGNQAYVNLQEAQIAELKGVFPNTPDLAQMIIDNKEKVLDILTTTSSSRPRARKINGATRTKKNPAGTDTANHFLGEKV